MVELTPREVMITHLVAEGMRNGDIAKEMLMSEHVVKNRLRTIFDKLGFWNRTELALWYVKQTFESARKAE